jgi:glycosyltransferase involved in cell wall biosynthesis
MVLYLAFRHNPNDLNAGSGADYAFWRALQDRGFEVSVHGPFAPQASFAERLIKRTYEICSRKKWMKFSPWQCRKIGQSLLRAESSIRPDFIFTVFPATLSCYEGCVPCVARLDSTFLGYNEFCSNYGQIPLRMSVRQELAAFRKCILIITHSSWSRNLLMQEYDVPESRILMLPNPANLPNNSIPSYVLAAKDKTLLGPLRLLFVGRDATLKRLDVAIKTVGELIRRGIATTLDVCGLSGDSTKEVFYHGVLKKSASAELGLYTNLYRRAHLLLHPTAYDASPVVSSEAAAFGTPTISQDVGGVATSVLDGVSGIVLPRGSGSREFAECIECLIREPTRYYELSRVTRMRYEAELNWDVAGRKVAAAINGALQAHEESVRIV